MAVGTATRSILMLMRLLQWASAGAVLGLVSYFIHKGHRGTHLIYDIIIAAISLVAFLPGLLSPFIPKIGWIAFPIDLIFSYLWLTAFIFAAQDYSAGADCRANAPPGFACRKKHALEAMIFLAFIFTLFSALLEIRNLWLNRRAAREVRHHKEYPRTSADTAMTGTAPVV